MDGKMLARIGAVVFVGVAITATAIEMTRKPDEPEVRILRPDLDAQTAPSRPILRRCRDMGEAATRDPACLKAWAQNRDRFLKQGSEISTSAPDAPGAWICSFALRNAASFRAIRAWRSPSSLSASIGTVVPGNARRETARVSAGAPPRRLRSRYRTAPGPRAASRRSRRGA